MGFEMVKLCVTHPGLKLGPPEKSSGSVHVMNFVMSRVMRKSTFWFPTWSDTNQAVQLQKMARGLKFRIQKVERLYYLCSENKGAVTAKLICVFVFAYAKCWFSHDAAHI